MARLTDSFDIGGQMRECDLEFQLARVYFNDLRINRVGIGGIKFVGPLCPWFHIFFE